MTSKNQHITEYLKYYLDKDHYSNFAVMLTGEWGVGKTYYIKEFIGKLEPDKKCIYVSLNGISNKSEIDHELFRNLHPILSSDGFVFAGNLLKNSLKATVRVDIDGDGKSDVDIKSEIPNIKISSLKRLGDKFIVFDDFERCSINKVELLGYINFFVEQFGIKVIIVCNEDEVDNAYRDIKEKVVGKTLKLVSDVDSALKDFFNHGNKCHLVKSLGGYVIDLCNDKKIINLRILFFALDEFSRVVDVMDPEYVENNYLCKALIKNTIALSYYVNSGKILAAEIPDLWKALYKEEHKVHDQAQRINKEFGIDLFDLVLSSKDWVDLIGDGFLEGQSINESISNSIYSRSIEIPVWDKLWDYNSLSPKNFDSLKEEVDKKIINKDFESLGEVFQIFGWYLQIIKKNISDESTVKLKNDFKIIIDARLRSNPLEFYDFKFIVFGCDSYGGKVFHSAKDDLFLEVWKYAHEISEKRKEESYEEYMDIFKDLLLDHKRFFNVIKGEELIQGYDRVMIFYGYKEIFDWYVSLEYNFKYEFSESIKKRFNDLKLHDSERVWLSDFKNYLYGNKEGVGLFYLHARVLYEILENVGLQNQ